MCRCLELAKLGKGNVQTNPLVGAVLVYNNQIIGEGYHAQFGKAHAEVNCLDSVKKEDQILIPHSTLYVSLEPCIHFGKTPPCTNLIIQNKIKKVIIGCKDSYQKVNGKGIEKLREAGIEVIVGILENESRELNKSFFIFNTHHRPYIILKWAQSFNKKIASNTNERLIISNDFSNRLVHQWRSEIDAILVGTTTALIDNPVLNNRLWNGKNPVRMVVDLSLNLPPSLNIFDNSERTLIFNLLLQKEIGNTLFYKIDKNKNIIYEILNACYQLNFKNILVEGGAKLLQSFLDENIWDEVRIITNEKLFVQNGLSSPELKNIKLVQEEKIITDRIQYFVHE